LRGERTAGASEAGRRLGPGLSFPRAGEIAEGEGNAREANVAERQNQEKGRGTSGNGQGRRHEASLFGDFTRLRGRRFEGAAPVAEIELGGAPSADAARWSDARPPGVKRTWSQTGSETVVRRTLRFADVHCYLIPDGFVL